MSLSLLNIFRKLIRLTGYLQIKAYHRQLTPKAIRSGTKCQWLPFAEQQEKFASSRLSPYAEMRLQEVRIIPPNLLAFIFYSLEDADLRARFLELLTSVGSTKFHNACNVADDDRGKYRQLEG